MAILPHKTSRIKKVYFGSKSFLISSDGCINHKTNWRKPERIDKRSGTIKTYLPFDKDGNSSRGSYNYDIHTLIAKAFNENNENFDTVLHIDGNKTNNHPSNLKWTYRNKRVYKYKKGGEYTNESFDSVTNAGNSLLKKGKDRSSAASVSACCNRKKPNWSGFEWSFLPPEEYKTKRLEIIIEAENYKNKTRFNEKEYLNRKLDNRSGFLNKTISIENVYLKKYNEIEYFFNMNNTDEQLFDIVLQGSLFEFDV